MAVTVNSSRRPAAVRPRGSVLTLLRENVIWLAAAAAMIYLLLPNLILVLFSFNKPNGRFNYTWQRFSLDAWQHPCAAPGMCHSLGLSLKLGQNHLPSRVAVPDETAGRRLAMFLQIQTAARTVNAAEDNNTSRSSSALSNVSALTSTIPDHAS